MTFGIPTYKTKYKSVSDVPDKYVKTFSERDPNNKFYQTRKWYDMKKRQILFSQNDGVPIHLRTPALRAFYYTTWVVNVSGAIYGIYLLKQLADGKLKK